MDELAAELLGRLRHPAPTNPFLICEQLGFAVRYGKPGCRPCLVNRTIIVPPGMPREWTGFSALHEVAHGVLRALGLRDSEANANALASALLLPAEHFDVDLIFDGWDILALKSKHPHASHEAIGRRIVERERAVMWCCDRGPTKRKQYRLLCKGAPASIAKRTRLEWDAVGEAAQTLAPVRRGCVHAFPLPAESGFWLRVICISDADALAKAL